MRQAPGAYGLVAVIGIERGGEPQYAIPILGMLMGNSINAQAVTLSTVLSDVKERHQGRLPTRTGGLPRCEH